MGRILVVDDEEMNRDMLSRRLKKKGFEITVAVNGEEACEKAAAEQPDLILMDMMMPIMDGYAATRQLKSQQQTSGIPVIGLTAFAMSGDREKVLAAGCDEYEMKPIQLANLLEKIHTLLGTSPDAAQ